jgi:hypothetical protein
VELGEFHIFNSHSKEMSSFLTPNLFLNIQWYTFGWMTDKFMYNPAHPYIFWMPVAGFLMLRNSSKYLTEVHSTVLEFFGRITLETYVLQFHLFMCKNVQHIPIVIPGSGPDGALWLRTANMLLCGVIFVSTALWARKVTVSTQLTVVELVAELRKKVTHEHDDSSDDEKESFMEISKVPVKETELTETQKQADV